MTRMFAPVRRNQTSRELSLVELLAMCQMKEEIEDYNRLDFQPIPTMFTTKNERLKIVFGNLLRVLFTT